MSVIAKRHQPPHIRIVPISATNSKECLMVNGEDANILPLSRRAATIGNGV